MVLSTPIDTVERQDRSNEALQGLYTMRSQTKNTSRIALHANVIRNDERADNEFSTKVPHFFSSHYVSDTNSRI